METITSRAAAKILGYSPRHVRYLAAAGSLPGSRVGRDWLFDRKAVEQVARERKAASGRR